DGVTIELTAAYVAEYLTLGYASTVHAGQGRTVDTSHAVVGADTDAAGLLVPMTRGRDSNVAYVVTQAVAADLPTGAATEVEPRVARAVLADVLERGGHDVSAQQQIVEAETEHRSTWRNVGELVEGVVVATAGATSATLDRLAEAGTLTEAQRRDLAADDSMGAVERILRAAELAGHDRDQVLTEALEDRSLVGARSTGQVLYHRIQAKVEKSLAPHVESFHDLIPADAAERVRPWLEERAERADDRRRELGEHIADTAPAWAIDALGPVPEEILSRAVWEHKAGWAAAYRELAGHEDERDALGAAPSTGLAEKYAVWRTAHQALDLPDARADEREMTDGQLRARVAGYDRERAWAPAWVDDDLAATHQEAAKARANAAIWSAHAAADGADAETAARLREEADAERVRAAQLQEQADQLALSDEARAAWFAHTAVSLDKATRARAELETRGVDLEQPADRTTADEWVRTHAEVVGAEDAYREVDVLADDVAEHVDVLDGPVLETDVADIRDLAVEDERERADVAREADRAKLDDTAAMVARAQQALAEIEARDAAFARRAADEAHQVELARWTEEQEREEAARDESDAIWV
ncbi:MAG: hypothetical protein JWR81_2846, partial [Pseudonocardia sp.]|nr:hypothetical protein [Pseudonocardia sp.]